MDRKISQHSTISSSKKIVEVSPIQQSYSTGYNIYDIQIPKTDRDASYRATVFDRQSIRQGLLRPTFKQLQIGTWNVEGLTDTKLITLQHYMKVYDIHILCLQETHKPLSDYVETNEGFLLILSG